MHNGPIDAIRDDAWADFKLRKSKSQERSYLRVSVTRMRDEFLHRRCSCAYLRST